MPSWAMSIHLSDIWKSEELSFPERRDGVVDRIRKSGWETITNHPLYLTGTVNILAECDDVVEFDHYWNNIYDIADEDRVWISTF